MRISDKKIIKLAKKHMKSKVFGNGHFDETTLKFFCQEDFKDGYKQALLDIEKINKNKGIWNV